MRPYGLESTKKEISKKTQNFRPTYPILRSHVFGNRSIIFWALTLFVENLKTFSLEKCEGKTGTREDFKSTYASYIY